MKTKPQFLTETLVEPTSETRLAFVAHFVPRWMKDFGRNDWEVAQRLAEEIDENFQFTATPPQNTPIDKQGLYHKDYSVAHIIVCQQLEIQRLIAFAKQKSSRKAKMS